MSGLIAYASLEIIVRRKNDTYGFSGLSDLQFHRSCIIALTFVSIMCMHMSSRIHDTHLHAFTQMKFVNVASRIRTHTRHVHVKCTIPSPQHQGFM
ncbi:hypothetical protein PUN28_005785 [Cardiocondyla obscurior]|uniref:Uncharacterized protein n=1 Tax=Cardiocondyla obscurior TaxID=286306 RepID=A0AAW2GBQ0_9HYME